MPTTCIETNPVEHTHSSAAPADFFNSKFGIAVLMIASSIGGGWLKDRLTTETRDSGSAVRIESLEKRIDQVQSLEVAAERNALSAVAFNEFREANNKRLDSIQQDLRDISMALRSRR